MLDSPPTRTQSTNKISTNVRIFIVIVVAIAVAICAGLVFQTFRSKSVPESAPSSTHVASESFRPTKNQWTGINVAPVKLMVFRTERLTEGSIAYNEDAMTQVFSPYTGRVTRVIAKLGDILKRGAPLMAVVASEVVQAKNDLTTAINTFKTTQEQVSLTTASEKRQHALYLAKSGALKDWLQSQTDLAVAQNNLHTAEVALDAVRDRLRILGKSEDEISALETGFAGRQVNPESPVLAPISGTVIQRQVGVGQYINSVAGGAASPVFTIGNLSTLWLIANVRESDAPLIHVGQPIEVHVLAYPGRKFQAKITWIAPSIDSSTHRLPVRAEVQNTDGTLKAMMFANFTIITGKEATSPSVPQSAVIYLGEEARVYVVLSDGTIALRLIKLGRMREDGMLEVISGLAQGEKIVTGGTLFIDRAVTLEMDNKQ